MLDSVPGQAWMVVAVAIAGFLLLVGLKVYKSKSVKIDIDDLDVECKDDATEKQEEKKGS